MPLRVRIAALGATLVCAACAHDFSVLYDGAWSGICATPLDFVIRGEGGRAAPHVSAFAAANPACPLPVPIVVQSETATQIVLAIKGAEGGFGCADSILTLKLVDSNHLEGNQVSGATRATCRLTRR